MKLREQELTNPMHKRSHALRNTGMVVGALSLLCGSVVAGGVVQQVKWQTKHGGLAIRNYGVVRGGAS